MIDPQRLRVIDLEQPRHNSAPMHPAHVPPGSSYLLHRRHEKGGAERRTGAAGVLVSSEHAGTHIDALCHQAEDLRLYGGRRVEDGLQTSFGFKELGVETIPPIVAGGLLIDLVRHRGRAVEPGGWISLDEVRAAATAQGVEPGAGSVVLIRTGNGRNWADPELYLRGSGMAGAVSSWLAGTGVLAVGADNMAWDLPGEKDSELDVTLPGHVLLLVRAGVYILENLQLEELGDAGATAFTFVCLPLKLRGATGSPVRPIALLGADAV